MVNISRLANPFIQWPFTSKLIGWIFMAYKYGGVLPNKKHQKPLSGPWNLIPPSIDPPLWLRCSKSPLVASWRPGGKNQLAEIEQKATVWKPHGLYPARIRDGILGWCLISLSYISMMKYSYMLMNLWKVFKTLIHEMSNKQQLKWCRIFKRQRYELWVCFQFGVPKESWCLDINQPLSLS